MSVSKPNTEAYQFKYTFIHMTQYCTDIKNLHNITPLTLNYIKKKIFHNYAFSLDS